jgi:hypothetical protein
LFNAKPPCGFPDVIRGSERKVSDRVAAVWATTFRIVNTTDSSSPKIGQIQENSSDLVTDQAQMGVCTQQGRVRLDHRSSRIFGP